MSSRLAGSVVLTREPPENDALARELAARGAEVLEVPCIRTLPLDDPSPLADAIRALGPDGGLVVTSPRGAEAVVAAVRPEEIRAHVSAIGTATALPLLRAGVVAHVADALSGNALARQLPLPRGKILLARSDRALPDLPERLRARGATVEEVVAYRTVPGPRGEIERARSLLRTGAIVVIAFASSSAVDAFLTASPADELRRAGLVAIGPTTARRIRERVAVEPHVAARPDLASLLAAIERSLKEIAHAAHA